MRRSRLKSKVRCRARHSSTTPRLLAKWAGRMRSTRTSSSRISCASSTSCSSLSLWRSAGDPIVGNSALIAIVPCPLSLVPGPQGTRDKGQGTPLSISLHNTAGQGGQAPAGGAERGQGLLRLLAQSPRPEPALGHAEEAGVGQLAAGGVLAHALAGLLGAALHVEQV